MKESFIIDADFLGVSIRNFIKKKFSTYTTREIEALISQNGCMLNQKIERFGSTKLNIGDQIEIFPKFLSKKTQEKEKIPVLFEDEFILAIDKPSGLSSIQKDIEEAIGQKIFLVHRLDKLTSGILLLAKTSQAQKAIEKLFFDREINKQYLALVHGKILKEEGNIDKPLRLKKRYEGGVIYQTTLYGKPAVTEWKKVMGSSSETLLSLQPITGRTHQLRVHLDSIDRPIMGDPQYGTKTKSTYHVPRLMLHARKMSFKHPFLNKKVEIIAPVPIIMRDTISKLFKKHKKCAF